MGKECMFMMENGNVWTFDKIAECAGAIRENMGRVIIGKQDVIKLVIAGLFATLQSYQMSTHFHFPS